MAVSFYLGWDYEGGSPLHPLTVCLHSTLAASLALLVCAFPALSLPLYSFFVPLLHFHCLCLTLIVCTLTASIAFFWCASIALLLPLLRSCRVSHVLSVLVSHSCCVPLLHSHCLYCTHLVCFPCALCGSDSLTASFALLVFASIALSRTLIAIPYCTHIVCLYCTHFLYRALIMCLSCILTFPFSLLFCSSLAPFLPLLRSYVVTVLNSHYLYFTLLVLLYCTFTAPSYYILCLSCLCLYCPLTASTALR